MKKLLTLLYCLTWYSIPAHAQWVTLHQQGDMFEARLESAGESIVAVSVEMFYPTVSAVAHDTEGHSACAETYEAGKQTWSLTAFNRTKVILWDPMELDVIPPGPIFTCSLVEPIMPTRCIAEASDADGRAIRTECRIVAQRTATPSPTNIQSTPTRERLMIGLAQGVTDTATPTAASSGGGCAVGPYDSPPPLNRDAIPLVLAGLLVLMLVRRY